jgi:excisionase family DNA binding protein
MPLKEINNHLLTPLQLAERLGYAVTTIRKWARERKIPAIKIGDDWRFTEGLTFQTDGNTIDGMGRRKKGYKGPKYLIKRPGTPFWYIKWKDVYKSTETENLAQAQLRLAEEQQKYWARQILEKDDGQSVTFSRLVHRYLKEVTPEKCSPKSDHTNARKPLEFWSEKRIDTFVPQDLYQYQEWRKVQYVELKKEGAKPTRLISGATINRELALVKHALHKAVRWGYLQHSPIQKGEVEGMKERKRERYITDAEFKSIVAHLDALHKKMIRTLYYTAQRSGRIFRLRWKQVDLEQRIITFENSSANKKVPPVIWINDLLYTILYSFHEERKRHARITPYVFAGRNGKPFRSIKTTWNKACAKAGVQDAHVHDIRHKAITDMQSSGVPLAIVQQAVGHSQSQTTDGYTHIQAETTKCAFEVLGRKLLE